MRISSEGSDLIKKFESLSLVAYPDPGSLDGSPWTIGFGSTGPDIKMGTLWTKKQADERFARDLIKFEDGVSKTVTVPLKQNQFDALVSFAYNIGLGAFRSSTLLKMLNKGDYEGAALQFARWNKNGGKVMNGLVNRRESERKMFCA